MRAVDGTDSEEAVPAKVVGGSDGKCEGAHSQRVRSNEDTTNTYRVSTKHQNSRRQRSAAMNLQRVYHDVSNDV